MRQDTSKQQTFFLYFKTIHIYIFQNKPKFYFKNSTKYIDHPFTINLQMNQDNQQFPPIYSQVFIADQSKMGVPPKQRVSFQAKEIIESKLNGYEEYVLYLYEAIAMFIYVFGQLCTKSAIGIDLQTSILLFIGIPFAGFLSAGNFNSSITVGFSLCKFNRYSPRVFWIIIKAHFYNALIAQIFAYFLNNGKMYIPLVVNETHSVKEIIFSEFMGSFFLIYFVLLFANPKTTPLKDCVTERIVKSLHISIVVYVARKFAVHSYNSINPSIILARAIFQVFAQLNLQPLQDYIYFFIGDISGVLFAVYCHQYVLRIKLEAHRAKQYHQQHQKSKDIELLPIKK